MGLQEDILKAYPDLTFWGVGGDEMKIGGVELLYHLKDFSSWGYSEVLTKIPFYFRALDRLENECVKRQTRYALLIDFQEFNMKLAQRLKKRGIKVMYYVAPQAWAWKSWRAEKLRQVVDTLFVILPFEKPWFEKRGVKNVRFVTHPLERTYRSYWSKIEERQESIEKGRAVKLLLLPGSRKSEVSSLLSEFREALKRLQKNHVLEVSLVRARHLDPELYREIRPLLHQEYTDDQLAHALIDADLCLAASGTVTLTCGLFALPTVVCYRTSLFNEFLFYTFVNYQGDVSLTNLVHGKRVFPELLQEKASGYNMGHELEGWLRSPERYREMVRELKQTRQLITGELKNTGEYIGNVLKNSLAK